MTQVCRVCGVEKPHTDFTFRKDNGKYRTDCDACRANREAARRYGLTVGQVEEMMREQGGRCAICETHHSEIPHKSFKHNPLVIDHDHDTGAVRGLLCPTCNNGLGLFKDSPALLQAAVAYLAA